MISESETEVTDQRGWSNNPTMDDLSWKEFAEALVDAKRSLREAWEILDGTDGAASGSEPALAAALSSIDAIFGVEVSHNANQDVAAPADVQAFWDEHGALPGFAVGT